LAIDTDQLTEVIQRARSAQRAFETYGQTRIDEAVLAAAWAGYSHASELARLAVEETGIGNFEDKLQKNRRKTLGTLRDLIGARSVGVIKVDTERGITEIAKPVGVVGAFTPLTNPGATVINNIMIALKGGNAIILAPHPKGDRTCREAVKAVHVELRKVGAPLDLVQQFSLVTPDKASSKHRAQELMQGVDLVLVTAGLANVKAAYSSGTPALGVGVGNVPVIVDATADIEDAAGKIARSKAFDNATSCSSENSILVQEGIYDRVLAALVAKGGCMLAPAEKSLLQDFMWKEGRLNRSVVGQSSDLIARLSGISRPEAAGAKFLMVEEEGIGASFPFSGEKLSPVLTVYRFHDFEEAVGKVNRILELQGRGHSCGIHTKDEEHVARLAQAVKVARVLVNQAHCIGNGGDFSNGLNFTLSMGAGTWGGNSTCDNITYKHLLNITRISRVIPANVPTEEELWGDYLRRYGK
jgi:sulfoacetaldehyde dehydrogenase